MATHLGAVVALREPSLNNLLDDGGVVLGVECLRVASQHKEGQVEGVADHGVLVAGRARGVTVVCLGTQNKDPVYMQAQ